MSATPSHQSQSTKYKPPPRPGHSPSDDELRAGNPFRTASIPSSSATHSPIPPPLNQPFSTPSNSQPVYSAPALAAAPPTLPPRTPIPRIEDNPYISNPYLSQPRTIPRKRALFVGICYFTTPRPLKGCINDVAAMRTFLNQTYGFPLEACLFLTDDSTDPMWSPTRRNILWGLQWLMHEAGPGDSLVFHFSGHGGQRATTNFADEPDGFDETILPVDHLTAGEILDDEMNEILVQGAPEGVKVTAIMDCCHSGSILDLMYSYDFPGTVAGSSFGPSVNTAIGDEVKQGSEGRPGIPMVSGQLANFSSKAPASLSTSVTCFSASVDGQESADTWLIGLPSGALSLGMISVLVENPFGMTVAEVYWKLRRWLEERGKRQTVMVSTSSYRDLNTEVFSF